MASVYIERDVLIQGGGGMLLGRFPRRGAPSVVSGAEGLPNSLVPFFQARRKAAEDKLWLLVNLQHPESEFSKVLNCEVFADPLFGDILGTRATLWQRDVGHPHAEQFIVYYCDGRSPTAEECPLVLLIDPRTGRALRRWRADGKHFPVDAVAASERLTQFFESHTLEGSSPPESPQTTPKLGPETCPESSNISALETEDEQNDLSRSSSDEAAESYDASRFVVEGLDGMEEVEPLESHSSVSPRPSEQRAEADEEAGGDGFMPMSTPAVTGSSKENAIVQLLFRWPDGTRSEHKFVEEDAVSKVLEAAASLLAEHMPGGAARRLRASDVGLETVLPPVQLQNFAPGTPLSSLDLHRKVVIVRSLREEV